MAPTDGRPRALLRTDLLSGGAPHRHGRIPNDVAVANPINLGDSSKRGNVINVLTTALDGFAQMKGALTDC